MLYAHTESIGGVRELLIDHLNEVARLCAENCHAAGLDSDEGYSVGLCHDLGKCGLLFQGVLQGSETKIDHESPGAYWILKKLGLTSAYDAALAIHAHHKGLTTGCINDFKWEILVDKQSEYAGRRYACSTAAIDTFVADEKLEPLGISACDRTNDSAIQKMLRVRMLLSALCDADYTATAAHFERVNNTYTYPPKGPETQFVEAFNNLSVYRDQLIKNSTADERINSIRRDLYQSALDAANWDSGLFSLTAPTGSGKTLAMLGFALRHAQKYNKRRIIFVLPYLTLIEQVAIEIRRALKPLSEETGYIFEDHSQAREGEVSFMIPNWEEPIIITTTIKFFESLFANTPSRVRHLHNVAGSIILFDEAQSMPFGYAARTLETLSELCANYNTSVVFSTATQPALDLMVPSWSPREIAPPELNLFGRARRLRIHWPPSILSFTSWDNLSDCILQPQEKQQYPEKQVLIIVNTRAQARKLIRTLQLRISESNLFHMSTNMCVAHRKDTLKLVKERLSGKEPCILVSTQCIEAGIDISFPVIYRALGPLESLVQACGRANRNGEYEYGDAFVFIPPQEDQKYPDTNYELATVELMRILKQEGGVDVDNPEELRKVFEHSTRAMEANGLRGKYELFDKAVSALHYKLADEHYRWIDQHGINVIVPYKRQIDSYQGLIDEAHGRKLKRDWLNNAQKIGVNISVNKGSQFREYLKSIVYFYNGEACETGWFFPIREELYDDKLGLLTDFTDTIDDFIL